MYMRVRVSARACAGSKFQHLQVGPAACIHMCTVAVCVCWLVVTAARYRVNAARYRVTAARYPWMYAPYTPPHQHALHTDINHPPSHTHTHVQKADSDGAWPHLPELAASLVAGGLVELDDLLGHLAPSDEDIKKVCVGVFVCG